MASGKLAGLISAMTMIACSTSFAQQGTEAQREACTPDAFRLCTSAMPDSGRVESCLRAAGPRLSAACAAVFNPPQDDTTRSVRDRRAPRERDVQQRDVQRRDRDYEQRYDQRDDRRDYQDRDYQPRGPRDGFGGPRDDDD